jgi:membrane-anchored protein YejM (alkaline phosphatase superfamily)
MDDRKTTQYFWDWLVSRQGPNATKTASKNQTANERIGTPRAKVDQNSTALSNKPFFAAIVFQNQHYPHLQHETYTGIDNNCSAFFESLSKRNSDYDSASNTTDDDNLMQRVDDDDISNGCWGWGDPISRYYSSLRTMDESLRELFGALNATDHLHNTIIMGAGDHGETPGVQQRLGGE